MTKIMIVDEKENGDLFAAILRDKYKIVTVPEEKLVWEKLNAEKPDIIFLSADSAEINYKDILSETVRNNPETAEMPAAIFATAVGQPVIFAGKQFNAEVIKRPFDPLEFKKTVEKLAELLIPVKERLDKVTGLHKREFTEDEIKKYFDKKSGTLFLIDIGKFQFASQPPSEDMAAKSAKAILKIAEDVHAVIGITKDKKFIGYLPSMTEREKCLRWGQRVIDETHKAFGEQKVYVSVGLASNDEKVENYEDLFQLCDRAVNLARERGKNVALYY